MQFSLNRFLYLFKLQIAVNRKPYLLGIAAIAGLMFCYMLFAVFTFDGGLSFSLQIDFLIIAIILTGGFFGSLIFKQYGDKDKRIQTILLPVSNVERLAVAILFTFFLFPIVFILLYIICVVPANALDVHVMGNMNDIYMIDGYEGKIGAMVFFFSQSLVLLGAISFRRLSFVKTVVMVCIIFIAISVMNDFINKAVLPDAAATVALHDVRQQKNLGLIHHYQIANAAPFQSLRFFGRNEDNYYVQGSELWVGLPSSQMIPFMLLLVCIPLFFFYITGVKLREQQL